MSFKVLYVEDDIQIKALIREMFDLTEYELIEAHDGQSGFEAALQTIPNLILMDIGLPDGDGSEVIRRIKQTPTLQHIPVIALTADDSQANKERCFAVGCANILFKPVPRFQLLDAVRRAIESQSQAAARAASAASVSTRPPDTNGDPSRKKVLIVDDNEDLRVIFSRVFDKRSFETYAASDGAQAIAYLQQTQPDVIILDVNMPGLSGFDVLSYVRGHQDISKTKVIMVTGNTMAPSDPQADLADLVLLKPVDINELLRFAKRMTGAA